MCRDTICGRYVWMLSLGTGRRTAWHWPVGVVRVCEAGGMEPTELRAAVALPDPALVVLVGPSGSGKSVWAAERYRPDEVVSSDRLRSLVGSGEHDLDASADAFALLDQIVAARLRRGLTAVVDTLGLDPARRRGYLELARGSDMPAVAVLADTDPAECRRRDRRRGMGPSSKRQVGSTRALAHPGREDRGQRAAAAASPDGLGAAALAIPVGSGPGRPGTLAGFGGPRRRRGRTAGNRADGSLDPDPPG